MNLLNRLEQHTDFDLVLLEQVNTAVVTDHRGNITPFFTFVKKLVDSSTNLATAQARLIAKTLVIVSIIRRVSVYQSKRNIPVLMDIMNRVERRVIKTTKHEEQEDVLKMYTRAIRNARTTMRTHADLNQALDRALKTIEKRFVNHTEDVLRLYHHLRLIHTSSDSRDYVRNWIETETT